MKSWLLILLTAAILDGCATLSFTKYYMPQSSDEKSRLIQDDVPFYAFGQYAPDIRYKCGDVAITIPSIVRTKFLTWGPPIIPFPIPFGMGDGSSLDVVITSEKKTQSFQIVRSAIIAGGEEFHPEKKHMIENFALLTATETYYYKFNHRGIEDIALKIETNDDKCGTFTIQFKTGHQVVYSML